VTHLLMLNGLLLKDPLSSLPGAPFPFLASSLSQKGSLPRGVFPKRVLLLVTFLVFCAAANLCPVAPLKDPSLQRSSQRFKCWHR